jgi:ABC-type transport system involved in cytochrome c biogenesis permease subunit
MDSGINILCFTASYTAALLLELVGLWRPLRLSRLVEIAAAGAGLIAHTWYLGVRVANQPAAPLSSQQEWFLLAAWLLAAVYFAARIYYPKKSLGLFLLPGVLGLIGAATLASSQPLAAYEAPRVWGLAHGVFLMLGTVAVLMGFFAGAMYLIQSRRLKQKLPASAGFRLPSLEWLERTNSRFLGAATVLVLGGFLTGVLTQLSQDDAERLSWANPVVLSLSLMTAWLLTAEAFRMIYPAARQGRKVAYLTVAAFVFLLLVFASVMWGDSFHQQRAGSRAPSRSDGRSPVDDAKATAFLPTRTGGAS